MKLKFIILALSFLLINCSTNAQSGWQLIYSFPEEVSAICLIDTITGFSVSGIMATTKKIIKTSYAGDTWKDVYTSGNFFTKIHFYNHSLGFTVGDNGIILRTTNGGVTLVQEGENHTQANSFLLSQNYPNPFNPATKIKFSIPVGIQRTVSVQLKVYDVLGNEIATLVNEEKPAGEYEVEFNISNIPGKISAKGGYATGVYLYQLRAGDYVETKKMVLLK